MLHYVNTPDDKNRQWEFSAKVWDEATRAQLKRDYNIELGVSPITGGMVPVMKISDRACVVGKIDRDTIYFTRKEGIFENALDIEWLRNFFKNIFDKSEYEGSYGPYEGSEHEFPPDPLKLKVDSEVHQTTPPSFVYVEEKNPPDVCKHCSANPVNGGNGVCNCTLRNEYFGFINNSDPSDFDGGSHAKLY